jgi:hypothetical protein
MLLATYSDVAGMEVAQKHKRSCQAFMQNFTSAVYKGILCFITLSMCPPGNPVMPSFPSIFQRVHIINKALIANSPSESHEGGVGWDVMNFC